MRHRGSRMSAESEGEKEQHLGPFGQAGIHVPGDRAEAVLAKIAGHKPQVIGCAIGANLRSHGIKPIQNKVRCKRYSEC